MNTDPDNYKWGIFYFNLDDPRLFVPKQIPWMGWTLNFANPVSWLIILAIIVFVVFISRFDS